jgi:hypothetical protein
MIGDFNDNANAMWSLHLGEAKSHDEARIHSLKEDMDSVLIFVRVYISQPSSFSSPSSCTVIQAGLFSATLTSFLIDSVNNLQVDPAQQMVFYQQQNVALLAQISRQMSSIAPQVSIPSTPLPSYDFSPNASDVRVNVYWFMTLVFSLSAALLATLVQQWVRDYMHVFQRYSNPLKSTRLRQYLYEGVEGWYMPRVARSVPGLVHVSLFLFFVGLGDSLLSVYTTVGITTIIPISICGFMYIFSMFAPVINPQSPFRNPFSSLIWYLKQKVHPRRYFDRASGGSLKAVSSNLSEGQMQLAMEEGDGRKYRDVRAIRWLIHNRTEDDEMESFVMAIPGTFTSKWGIDVWRKASGVKPYEDIDLRPDDPTVGLHSGADVPVSTQPHHRSPLFQCTYHPLVLLRPLGRIFGIRTANDAYREVTTTRPRTRRAIPHLQNDSPALDNPNAYGDLAIYDLCKRVRHLAGTCDNYSIFTNKELWLRRARGCVETAASLVFCADIKPELFGDLERLLPPLHDATMGTHTTPGSDGLFVARLDSLSFVIAHREMANYDGMTLDARAAIRTLSRFGMEDEDEDPSNGDDGDNDDDDDDDDGNDNDGNDDSGDDDNDDDDDDDDDDDENALRNARTIDQYFEDARQFCVYGLRETLRPDDGEMTEEQAREVLARDHEDDISMLEHIALATDRVLDIDRAIFSISDLISDFAGGVISRVSGAHFDDFEETGLLEPNQFFNPHPFSERPLFLPQFIYLHQRLRLLCSYSTKLRDIVNGQDNGAYQEILESLGILWDESDNSTWSGICHRHLMERQLWRLQDLRDGGGFGYWVELCLLIVEQLLHISLSTDAHSSLLLGMFRAAASNWRQHKHSIGTQRVILNIICDLAIPDRGPLSDHEFPRYIIDELLRLVENIVVPLGAGTPSATRSSRTHFRARTVEGQSGSHIDEAMRELEEAINERDGFERGTETCLFRAEAVKVISRSRAPAPSS